MGLFLGPLYTFYKAASAIVFARALERESGVRCVPVFWLQDEDHDFPEIGHCHLPEKLQISDAGVDPYVSVAHRKLGPDVTAQLDRMAELLAREPHAGETVALFREHYRPGQTLVAAFAGVLHALLPELTLFDPRTPEHAAQAAPVLARAISQCEAIDRALLARGEEIRAAGFEEQVNIRKGSPLAFLHDHPEGPRRRPEPGCDLAALAERVLREPMCASSSALLRPIVQDTMLPTAVYIGGPGEISYFAQVAALYPLFGLEPPVVAPRARLRVIEHSTRKLLDQLGLTPAEVEKPREELARKLASAQTEFPPPDEWRRRMLEPLSRALDELDALNVDANLRDPIRRTRETVEHGVSRLLDKYARALASRDEIAGGRLDRLRAALLPEGIPQERFLSLPPLLARHGVREFPQRVIDAIKPWGTTIVDLEP